MSQLQLNRVSKEIIDHAERALVPDNSLPKVVDDYFIQLLKQDEMHHAQVDPRLYDGMRKVVKTDILPLYEKFRMETAKIRERREKRKLWRYVLGTVGAFEMLETVLTRGRSIVPQVLIPTAIFYTFVGFIIYTAAQYLDDRSLARARKRLEQSLEGLERKVQVDVDYDQRHELMNTEVLRAEALEILANYEQPAAFWGDYLRIRELDPTTPGEVRSLNAPAFERFLRFHVDGQHSAVNRQQRFNRLFIEAQEVFISRDRDHYVVNQLKNKT